MRMETARKGPSGKCSGPSCREESAAMSKRICDGRLWSLLVNAAFEGSRDREDEVKRSPTEGERRQTSLEAAPTVVGKPTAGQGTISVAASFGLEDGRRPWVIALIVAGLKDFCRSARVWIEGLGPYPSLALLVAPACLVEPAKLVALAIIGEGHWMTGALGIAAAYGFSIFLIERLFTIVKPKLLRLRWFAKLWAKIIVLRYLLALPFRDKPPTQVSSQ
jgi:hypothetical protein